MATGTTKTEGMGSRLSPGRWRGAKGVHNPGGVSGTVGMASQLGLQQGSHLRGFGQP